QAREQQFRNSEWGPDSNDVQLREFRDLPCPWGGKMSDILDSTPPKKISKVFIAEKLFKTWYNGRTVLIGDGLGAVDAMQDAVVLANCIYNMRDTRPENITAAFKDYYRERYNHADKHFHQSSMRTKAWFGQTWSERAVRHIFLNCVPKWVHQKTFTKIFEYRPQVVWLPQISKRE
ncbi:hypothetical protein BGZ65_009362, partial [Modicella reniformis]